MIVYMILKIFSVTSRRTSKRNLNLPRLLRGADERRDQPAEVGPEAGDEADIGAVADTGGVGVEVNPTRDDTEVPGEREVATGAEREVLRDTARVTMTTTMIITTLDTGKLRTGELEDTDRSLREKFQNHV